MTDEQANPRRTRQAAALVVLLLVAFLPKLSVLLAPRADLHLVGSRGIPQTWNGEEIHRGTTAYEFAHGPILDFLDYHYAPFFGGSLVLSVLAAPLFRWLGTSIVVLKLVPLALHLLSVCCLYAAVRRLGSGRAAFLAALLLALPPPGYTIHTLTAFGTHVESNAIACGLLWLFLATWWRQDGKPPSLRRAFACGCLAGFGIYFGYILLLTVVALAGALLWRDKKAGLRPSAAAFVIGLLIGLTPWWIYNATHNFRGLAIYGKPIAAAAAPAGEPLLQRLGDLLRHGLPDSAFFRSLPYLTDVGANRLYTGAIGAVLLLFGYVYRAEIKRALGALLCLETAPEKLDFAPFLLAQPLAFCAAYACTSFRVGEPPDAVVAYRYVHVLWPWLFAAAGLGLDRLLRGARLARALAGLGLLVALALAGAGTLALVDREQWQSDLRTPGYSYLAFGRFLVLNFDEEPSKIVTAVERAQTLRSPEEYDLLLFGMGMQLREGLRASGPAGPRLRGFRERAEGLRRLLQQHVPAQSQPYFDAPLPGEPNFGRAGLDERRAFWDWHAQAQAPAERPQAPH